MSAYRKPPRRIGIAPRAPRWRMLRAWAGGTFARIERAQGRRLAELIRRRMRAQADAFRARRLGAVRDDASPPRRFDGRGGWHAPQTPVAQIDETPAGAYGGGIAGADRRSSR
jgi:hypothetical protein